MSDLINARGRKVDERCQLCGMDEESIHHSRFECSSSRQVWAPGSQYGFQKANACTNINFLFNIKSVSRGDIRPSTMVSTPSPHSTLSFSFFFNTPHHIFSLPHHSFNIHFNLYLFVLKNSASYPTTLNSYFYFLQLT